MALKYKKAMRILTLIAIFFWILIQGEFLVMKIAEVGVIHKWSWVKVFSPTYVIIVLFVIILLIEGWIGVIREYKSAKKQ